MSNNSFKVGDKIIDSDQVYVIFKIENDKIFYCPFDKKKSNCTGSIPIENLDQACIRHLMTKNEVADFLKSLTKVKPIEMAQPATTRNNNGAFLKDILYSNDVNKTAKLLVYLSNLKQNSPKLVYSDQSVYDQALNHLAEEISVVMNTSIDQAREKILKAIER